MSTLTAPAPLRPGRAVHAHVALRTSPAAASPMVGRIRWDRIMALVVVVAALAWFLGAGLAGRSGAEAIPAAPITVVVQPGDTIWDLARTHAPDGVATLIYVMQVEQHNGVRSGALIPGTVLQLPQG